MGNLYKNESKPTHSANMFAIFSEGVKEDARDLIKYILQYDFDKRLELE